MGFGSAPIRAMILIVAAAHSLDGVTGDEWFAEGENEDTAREAAQAHVQH